MNIRPLLRFVRSKPALVKALSSLLLLIPFASPVSAQGDSLADVFPLHVGQRWHYATKRFSYNGMDEWFSQTDSGQVTITVTGAVHLTNATNWTLQEHKDVRGYGKKGDSNFVVRDTGTYSYILTEIDTGRHQLLFPQYWRVPPRTFSFHDDPDDGIPGSIFRYSPVDTNGRVDVTYEDNFDPFGNHHHHHIFTADVGETFDSVFYSGEWSTFTYVSTLIDTTMLNVGNAGGTVVLPVTAILAQNYPNPFNPTTTIRYSLSTESHVRITIFDILGREALTLVNGIELPGEKAVEFDGSAAGVGLPSGVYFYRLEAIETANPAQSVRQTRKLLLVR